MSRSIDELRKAKEAIEAELREAEEKEQQRKEDAVIAKIDALTEEQKEFILSLMDHERTSCSDSDPCNGYSYTNERFRCRKCMLMEILNHGHGGCYDFKFTVDIDKVMP